MHKQKSITSLPENPHLLTQSQAADSDSKISISEIHFGILLMLPWPKEATKLNTK